RHPCELVLGQELTRDDRDDAGKRLRPRRVDRLDPRVGERAPEDRHVEHVRQLDVVEVVAPPLDEAVVLLALHALPEPEMWVLPDFRLSHAGASSWCAAAHRTALTM